MKAKTANDLLEKLLYTLRGGIKVLQSDICLRTAPLFAPPPPKKAKTRTKYWFYKSISGDGVIRTLDHHCITGFASSVFLILTCRSCK